MTAIAHFIATTCYLGAGVLAHAFGLIELARAVGQAPVTGLGPALSCAAIVLAAMLLVVELVAHDVSLTLVAAPLAALLTVAANMAGLVTEADPPGGRGAWFVAHIALSLAGLAAMATAAAAGTMYLIQRRELRSRRFGPLFRLFPPLQTLDRVNHVAVIAGWIGLTLGILMGLAYSVSFHQSDMPQVIWGLGAWAGVTALALGRVVRGWEARRAAVAANTAFAGVVLLWIAMRVFASQPGKFL